MTLETLEAALDALARRRAVFHSEADFKHALAWQLQLDHPEARIRLETRPLPGRAVFLDLLFDHAGVRTAVELKYPVRNLVTAVDEERFELRAQSAHDVRRYDVVKDIARLEAIVAARAADAGAMIALTNDPAYWSAGRDGTVDAVFRLHDGVTLSGTVAWAPHAGAGTTANRTEPLTLRGTYDLHWRDYSDTGDRTGCFRVLVVPVTSAASHVAVATAPPTAERVETRPSGLGLLGTCRQQILDAFASLERRHGRETFALADLVDEVLARGSQHSEATIRTHIVSVMCVDAPANHAVRYPDLERVDRGLYRRRRQ